MSLTCIVLLQVTFGRTENFTILTMVVHFTESLLAMMAEEFPKLSYIRSIFSINVGVLLLQLLLVFGPLLMQSILGPTVDDDGAHFAMDLATSKLCVLFRFKDNLPLMPSIGGPFGRHPSMCRMVRVSVGRRIVALDTVAIVRHFVAWMLPRSS